VCVCVCVIVCDLETSKRGGLGPSWDFVSQKNIYNKLWDSSMCITFNLT